ncbi:MAG TPA: hypothetical protein VHK69_01505 [Chitinophagaceae bacterium]|jgi:hypothetical protein|nr:hypothetical protein [Chitinophagaceae bacterium]
MKDRKKLSYLIGIGFIGIIFLLGVLETCSLERNAAVTHGFIYKLGNSRYSSGLVILYRFTVKGETYTGSESIPCSRDKVYFQSSLFGRRIRIVYDTTDPGINEMLLRADTYREYGFTPPPDAEEDARYIDSLCTAP